MTKHASLAPNLSIPCAGCGTPHTTTVGAATPLRTTTTTPTAASESPQLPTQAHHLSSGHSR